MLPLAAALISSLPDPLKLLLRILVSCSLFLLPRVITLGARTRRPPALLLYQAGSLVSQVEVHPRDLRD